MGYDYYPPTRPVKLVPLLAAPDEICRALTDAVERAERERLEALSVQWTPGACHLLIHAFPDHSICGPDPQLRSPYKKPAYFCGVEIQRLLRIRAGRYPLMIVTCDLPAPDRRDLLLACYLLTDKPDELGGTLAPRAFRELGIYGTLLDYPPCAIETDSKPLFWE